MKKNDKKLSVVFDIDCTPLDAAIEKANRLVELLERAITLIDSLRSKQPLES